MRLVRYLSGNAGPRTGAVLDGRIVDLHGAVPHHVEDVQPGDMSGLLALGDKTLRAMAAELSSGNSKHVPIAKKTVQLLSPIHNPAKIICAWVNYPNPAVAKLPEAPIFFSKYPSALLAPEKAIILPRIASQIVVEPELAAVIGRGGKHIAEQKALAHVAGYTICNDVTAFSHRLQVLLGSPGPYAMAKTFDTFLPCGPALVTRDEIADPHNLFIRQWLNGDIKTQSDTSRAIFRLPRLISYVSDFFRLEPGDLILTGSPPPDGAPAYLSAGDKVSIEIENIGVLNSTVVAEREAPTVRRTRK
ncbi:MAG: fumarylacetoacetate hydrolase family protein [Nitrospiraceae bacterium]